MNNNTLRITIISLITIGIVAMGSVALAGRGMGSRDCDNAGGGYGRHGQGAGCPYGRQAANLTDEQREQLDTERQAFFEATRTERQDIYAKRLELRAEMAKRNPDVKKASAVQKEISDLQGSLDQKRLTHMMKVREINPDAGMGWFKGGPGARGQGHKRGYGSGYCRQ